MVGWHYFLQSSVVSTNVMMVHSLIPIREKSLLSILVYIHVSSYFFSCYEIKFSRLHYKYYDLLKGETFTIQRDTTISKL